MSKIYSIMRDIEREWECSGLSGDTLYDKFAREVVKRYAASLEAQLKEREWISVKDRIPDNADKVIVSYSKGITIAKYWETTGMWLSNNANVRNGDLVTHWMPLPEAPQ